MVYIDACIHCRILPADDDVELKHAGAKTQQRANWLCVLMDCFFFALLIIPILFKNTVSAQQKTPRHVDRKHNRCYL